MPRAYLPGIPICPMPTEEPVVNAVPAVAAAVPGFVTVKDPLVIVGRAGVF